MDSDMHSGMEGKAGEHMQEHMMEMDSEMMTCHETETPDITDENDVFEGVDPDEHSEHH